MRIAFGLGVLLALAGSAAAESPRYRPAVGTAATFRMLVTVSISGYAETFAELMAETKWQNYGTESGNPECANCMVHSGYEATAVDHTFSGLRGLLATAKATLFASYIDPGAQALLNEPVKPVHSYNPLIQIETPSKLEETRA